MGTVTARQPHMQQGVIFWVGNSMCSAIIVLTNVKLCWVWTRQASDHISHTSMSAHCPVSSSLIVLT